MSAWVCRDNSGTDLFTFEANSFEDAIIVAQGDDRVPLDGAQIFPVVETVPGWAFEHGYVADGVEVVVMRFPASPGVPRLGFREKRGPVHGPEAYIEEMTALGVTEFFERVVPAEVVAA